MAGTIRQYAKIIVATIVIAASVVMSMPLYAQIDTLYTDSDTTQPTINNDVTCLISNINITGNKKTKPKTILCELEFEPGDTISKSRLPQLLDKSTTNLKKTSIFNYVTITYELEDDSLNTGLINTDININVEECWYTWV